MLSIFAPLYISLSSVMFHIPPIPSVPRVPSILRKEHRPLELPSISTPAVDMDNDTNKCRTAFLAMISYAEGTYLDGVQYNIIFGGDKFSNYNDHPRKLVSKFGHTSDAAGAFQFLSTTWDTVASELNIKDFTPKSQNLAALRLIERTGVLDDVDQCNFNKNIISSLSLIWAGLPYVDGESYYRQPTKGYYKLHEFWKKQLNLH